MRHLKKFNEDIFSDDEKLHSTHLDDESIEKFEVDKDRIKELIEDSFCEPELSGLLESYTNSVSGQLDLNGEISSKYQSNTDFGNYTYEIKIKRIG